MTGSQAMVPWMASLQLHPPIDKTWIRAAFTSQNCRTEASYIDCMDWSTHMDTDKHGADWQQHGLEALIPYLYIDMAT